MAFHATPTGAIHQKGCPIWVCTPPPDSRTIEQWQAQCKPVEARNPSNGITSFWCTSNQNPLDKDQQLPRGYIVL
jgi:hypothetical protein